MFCLDALKGKVLWEHEFRTGFYASPLLVGDLVYTGTPPGVGPIRVGDTFDMTLADSSTRSRARRRCTSRQMVLETSCTVSMSVAS